MLGGDHVGLLSAAYHGSRLRVTKTAPDAPAMTVLPTQAAMHGALAEADGDGVRTSATAAAEGARTGAANDDAVGSRRASPATTMLVEEGIFFLNTTHSISISILYRISTLENTQYNFV